MLARICPRPSMSSSCSTLVFALSASTTAVLPWWIRSVISRMNSRVSSNIAAC